MIKLDATHFDSARDQAYFNNHTPVYYINGFVAPNVNTGIAYYVSPDCPINEYLFIAYSATEGTTHYGPKYNGTSIDIYRYEDNFKVTNIESSGNNIFIFTQAFGMNEFQVTEIGKKYCRCMYVPCNVSVPKSKNKYVLVWNWDDVKTGDIIATHSLGKVYIKDKASLLVTADFGADGLYEPEMTYKSEVGVLTIPVLKDRTIEVNTNIAKMYKGIKPPVVLES